MRDCWADEPRRRAASDANESRREPKADVCADAQVSKGFTISCLSLLAIAPQSRVVRRAVREGETL